MSQNGPYSGPPWSRGSSDEPYREPADPWGDQGTNVPQPAWGGPSGIIPQQPAGRRSATPDSGSMWSAPPPAPPRRNTLVVALVAVLAVLTIIGLGAAAWWLSERDDRTAQPAPSAAPSTPASPGPAPQGSEDARFYVEEGDCVINQGTDDVPDVRTTACTSGTYQVLKRIKGKTTGEKDAENKCSRVRGYTKWYFYDSPLDDLDFVLCLKEYKDAG